MASAQRSLHRRQILQILGDPNLRGSATDLAAAGVDLSSDTIERELGLSGGDRDDTALPLWYSERTGGANFSGVEMSGAHLERAKVWRADFTGANLHGSTLQDADIGLCDFERADLTDANLVGATLARASFRDAVLTGARFGQADLRDVNFTGARFDRIYLAEATLGNTRLSRTQVEGRIGEDLDGNYRDAISAYASLKVNFRVLGRFDDASWAYMQERRMETKSLAPWRLPAARAGVKDRLGWGLRWLAAGLTGLVAGYGERPLRAVACVPALIATYACVFWELGDLTTDGRHAASMGACLRYSAASFVTLSAGGLQAVEPRTGGAQLLTSIEAMTGVSLLALVMFSLGKRITRS